MGRFAKVCFALLVFKYIKIFLQIVERTFISSMFFLNRNGKILVVVKAKSRVRDGSENPFMKRSGIKDYFTMFLIFSGVQ
jgi:hypothetical protein